MKYSRDWPHDVYVILDANNDRVKIGHSAVPTRRLRTLQSACSEPLLLSLTMGFETKDAAETFENELHKEFEDFQIRGEWFEHGEYLVDRIRRDYAPTPEQVRKDLATWTHGYVPSDLKEQYGLWRLLKSVAREAAEEGEMELSEAA